MKSEISRNSLVALAGLVCWMQTAARVSAQEPPSAAAPNPSPTAPANPPAPVQFSYGVGDVLKLARAKVSDDVTVTFIQASGHGYSLSADEIVQLRKEGVTDRVLTAMLGKQPPAAPAAAAPANNAYAAAPQYATPPVTYVEPAPAYVPASTVYVFGNSSYGGCYSYPYYSYPRYYAGYGGCFPALSVGFSVGGARFGYRNNFYGGNGVRFGAGFGRPVGGLTVSGNFSSRAPSHFAASGHGGGGRHR